MYTQIDTCRQDAVKATCFCRKRLTWPKSKVSANNTGYVPMFAILVMKNLIHSEHLNSAHTGHNVLKSDGGFGLFSLLGCYPSFFFSLTLCPWFCICAIYLPHLCNLLCKQDMRSCTAIFCKLTI